jgi:sugar phosphate permease
VIGFGVGGMTGFPAVVVVLAAPAAMLALAILTLPVPPRALPSDSVPLSRYLAQLGKLFVSESRELLKIRTLRWIMVSTTAMAFAAGGYIAWLIDYLENDKAMSKEAATTLLSTTMLGAVAGIVFGAKLADRWRRRTPAGRMWTVALGMSCALPCSIACIELPPGGLLYAAGIASMFFISWYHAPMAVSVDDLAPAKRAVAAQGLVIFTMHLLGTASASYVLGVVSDRWSLFTAMWLPCGGLAIAALAMLAAIPSFAREHARARSE